MERTTMDDAWRLIDRSPGRKAPRVSRPEVHSLVYWRLRRGLSQQVLAERVGVAPNTISSTERHLTVPRPGLRRRIADALEVDLMQVIEFWPKETDE